MSLPQTIKTSQRRYFILVSILFLFFLFISAKAAFAASYVITEDYSGSVSSSKLCPAESGCSGPPDGFCYNDEAVGVTKCGTECNGGDTWSKYEYKGCFQTGYDPDLNEYQCKKSFADSFVQVYSSGDKCDSGSTGLRPGSCYTSDPGGGIYKYCCTAAGYAEACTTSGVTQDQYNPPPEGRCPGGYIVDGSRVRSSSCVPLAPPSCSSYGSCGSCIGAAGCGWDGPLSSGSCESGTAACGGRTEWYWSNCFSNVCSEPAPDPEPDPEPDPDPAPSCPASGDNCVYSDGSGNCFSGKTTDPSTCAAGYPGCFNPSAGCSYSCGPVACPEPEGEPAPAPDPIGGEAACGELITGFLYSPTHSSTIPSPVKFEGQYWNQGGKCFGFVAEPSKSFLYIDGNQYSGDTFDRLDSGFFNKTITLPPGPHEGFVRVAGWCGAEKTDGYIDLMAAGGGCGTVNFTVSSAPPKPPICNSLTLTQGGAEVTKVAKGSRVTIDTSYSDDGKVDTIEIFRNSSIIRSQNNTTSLKPAFPITYEWDTTGLPDGIYNIKSNAIDNQGNITTGTTANGCLKEVELITPQEWVGPTCSTGGIFSGCSIEGAPTCTHWGGEEFKDPARGGWTAEKWKTCSEVCPLADRNSYCRGDRVTAGPFCDAALDSQIFWQWQCGNEVYSKITMYNRTLSKSQDYTVSSDQTTFLATGLPYSQDYDLSVRDTAGKVCDYPGTIKTLDCSTAPPPEGGPDPDPEPDSGTCQLGPLGVGGGRYQWAITTYPKSPTTPTSPQFSDTKGNSQSSFSWTCGEVDDPDDTVEGVWTCSAYTSSYFYGDGVSVLASFSDADNTCSKPYTTGTTPPPSCDDLTRDSFSITIDALQDPQFDSSLWRQYEWEADDDAGVCWAGWDSDEGGAEEEQNEETQPQAFSQTSLLAQSSNQQGQVLAAKSCFTDSDCVSSSLCRTGNCDRGWWELSGTCEYEDASYGTPCGTSSNGGSKYCGRNTKAGVCQDDLCKDNDSECSDGNLCTTEKCENQVDCDSDDKCVPAEVDECKYKNAEYGNVCGTTPYGGNMYCGLKFGTNDAICHNPLSTATPVSLCKTDKDCDDGNSCTEDKCKGYKAEIRRDCRGRDDDCQPFEPEELGQCSSENLSPTTICQGSKEDPQKLCSTGSNPATKSPTDPGYIASTCSVNYVACNSITQNNGFCCGLTNIQGRGCQGTCDQTFNVLKDPMTALSNVNVYVQSETCPEIFKTGVSNSSGKATFSGLPIGFEDSIGGLGYKVWTEVPPEYNFTRGVYSRKAPGKGGKFTDIRFAPPFQDGFSRTKPGFKSIAPINRKDEDGEGYDSGEVNIKFGFQKPSFPWLQTIEGDVHSNTRINTPGGP